MSPYVGLPGLNCTKTFSRRSLVWQQGKQKAYFYRLVLCCWWWCYSVAKSCLTFCDSMDCITLGFLVLHHLPELSQTHVHWVGDAIQPSHPLSPTSPPAFNLSQHQGLFWCVSSSHQVANWSFSFSISPSGEYSGLISFRIDWFDPFAVQRTLKSWLEDMGMGDLFDLYHIYSDNDQNQGYQDKYSR